MSTAVCNSEGSEVNVRYARGRRGGGQSYPASRDATTPFFGFLSSHDIAQGIQREKAGGGGTQGYPKVRLPPSYRAMPPEVRY